MSRLVQRIDEARKAIAGLLVPGLTVLGTAVLDGSDGGSRITTAEWIAVAIASLGTGGLVYGLRNGESPDPRTSTPEVAA
jgi:hypothetical protein